MSRCWTGPTPPASASGTTGSAHCPRPRRRRCCGSPRRPCTTRCGTPARPGSRRSCSRRGPAGAPGCGCATTGAASPRSRSAGPAGTWAWCPCGTGPPGSAARCGSNRPPAGGPWWNWRFPVAETRIRVLLVDDHQVVRRGLRTFLEVQDDIEVVGEAADGAQGVALTEDLRPDVVLMDVKMPGTDGIEALRLLKQAGNPARVLVVTSFTEHRTVVPALRAGAAGYVYKDVD